MEVHGWQGAIHREVAVKIAETAKDSRPKAQATKS
jgi:hypothetical protein